MQRTTIVAENDRCWVGLTAAGKAGKAIIY
jgi:hypothetical protein